MPPFVRVLILLWGGWGLFATLFITGVIDEVTFWAMFLVWIAACSLYLMKVLRNE